MVVVKAKFYLLKGDYRLLQQALPISLGTSCCRVSPGPGRLRSQGNPGGPKFRKRFRVWGLGFRV